jgi:hypothetical protein
MRSDALERADIERILRAAVAGAFTGELAMRLLVGFGFFLGVAIRALEAMGINVLKNLSKEDTQLLNRLLEVVSERLKDHESLTKVKIVGILCSLLLRHSESVCHVTSNEARSRRDSRANPQFDGLEGAANRVGGDYLVNNRR